MFNEESYRLLVSANRIIRYCNKKRNNLCKGCIFSSYNNDNPCELNFPYKWNIKSREEFMNLKEG